MIEWFERSRSARISSRGRAERATGRRSSRNGHNRSRMGGGSTPSRYSRAVPCRFLIVSIQAAKRDQQRLARQHRRQQREDVRETLAGAVAHELVDKRHLVLHVELVEQAPALPDRAAHRRLTHDHGEDPLGIDHDARILLEQRGQRMAALEPDLEPLVVEAEHEAVRGALRDAHREYARQAPPDGEVLIRIDQRVDEQPDPLFGHLPQREHRVGRHRVPGQQRDDVRDERRAQPFFAAQHPHDPVAVAGAQRQNRLDLGIEGRRRPRVGARGAVPGRPGRASRSRTASRRACAASASGSSSPRCPTDRARRRGSAGSFRACRCSRDSDGWRRASPPRNSPSPATGSRSTARRARAAAPPGPCRRQPRRRDGRTPRR